MSAKTEKFRTVVWLCIGGGAVSGTVGGILAQVNHATAGIWLGWVSIVLWCWGARTYVAYKHPAYNIKATVTAIIIAVLLIPAAWWLKKNTAMAQPSIHVESHGDHSPNIVGNSGPVSVQDDSGGQGKPPDKAPKPKGRDK